jgi:hypothetical protein
MKKLFALLMTVALLLGLTACFDSGRDNPTTVSEATPAQTTTAALEPTPTQTIIDAMEGSSQSPLPTYTPGSIKLEPGVVSDYDFTPTKRRLYYGIPGPFEALAPEGTINELFEKDKDIYTEPQEMLLVTLVKHCNISRQDFDKAVEEYKEMCASAGYDMAHEEAEIPNADIIYTFDNEIINAYYRRA